MKQKPKNEQHRNRDIAKTIKLHNSYRMKIQTPQLAKIKYI